MSLKTHESQGFARITTFDKESIFLTKDEYEFYKLIKNNPNTRFLSFDDGDLAIADIRRCELLKKPLDTSHQLKGEEFELIEEEKKEIVLTPEQKENAHKKLAEIANRLRQKEDTIPEVPKQELEEAKEELEELKERKYAQSY